MAEITNEFMYETLKSIQAQVAIVREDVDSMKTRLTAQDSRLSQMLGAIAGVYGDLAEVSGRICGDVRARIVELVELMSATRFPDTKDARGRFCPAISARGREHRRVRWRKGGSGPLSAAAP